MVEKLLERGAAFAIAPGIDCAEAVTGIFLVGYVVPEEINCAEDASGGPGKKAA